jgi:O-methyltransferase domain
VTLTPVDAGAKAYFIRRVLHDYSDEDCAKILSNIRAAMAPDSKVLIQEQIMPSIITNPELEANVAVLDVACMVMGGKERTEESFREVLEKSGLELVRIWKAEMAPAGIVEAKIKA